MRAPESCASAAASGRGGALPGATPMRRHPSRGDDGWAARSPPSRRRRPRSNALQWPGQNDAEGPQPAAEGVSGARGKGFGGEPVPRRRDGVAPRHTPSTRGPAAGSSPPRILTRTLYDEACTFQDEIDTYELDKFIKGTSKLFVADRSHVDLTSARDRDGRERRVQVQGGPCFNIPLQTDGLCVRPRRFGTGPIVGPLRQIRVYWDQKPNDVLRGRGSPGWAYAPSSRSGHHPPSQEPCSR